MLTAIPNRRSSMRHLRLHLILALAAPAAADTFEAVSPSHAVFFSPVGATADATTTSDTNPKAARPPP